MDKLVPLKLARLDERLATLGTDMHPGTMGVKVFAHRTVVAEHLETASMWTSDGSHVVVAL